VLQNASGTFKPQIAKAWTSHQNSLHLLKGESTLAQQNTQPPVNGEPRRTARHTIHLPGFSSAVILAETTEIGLGDVIKRATSLVGIKPCLPCSERAERLNAWVSFSSRD
jgi:hypothetical protein